jgi:hypothetical protein
MSYQPASFATGQKATAVLRNGAGTYTQKRPGLLMARSTWARSSWKSTMSRPDNFRKWHREMDASLIKMYASGNYSVSDFVRTIGAPASTIYDQMRRLRLPLLGQSGCKLRNYKSYGPRYNETIFSQEQVALLAHCNAEGWSDLMIARELRLSTNPVRRLRKRLGLPAHVRKAISIGTRYGNLIVQNVVSPKRKKAGPVSNSLASRSLCQCDCGGLRIAFNEDLRSGNTTTCGCHINVRNLDSEWIRVFHQYLGGAKRRGVRFALSVEQVKQICSLPCRYCGNQESNVALPPNGCHRSRTPLRYNGIDQVVQGAGYHPGNVLPCCRFCNRAKGNLALEIFILWINRVFRHGLTTRSIKATAIKLGGELKRADIYI